MSAWGAQKAREKEVESNSQPIPAQPLFFVLRGGTAESGDGEKTAVETGEIMVER